MTIVVAFVSNYDEKYLAVVVVGPVVGLAITVDHTEGVPLLTNMYTAVHKKRIYFTVTLANHKHLTNNSCVILL